MTYLIIQHREPFYSDAFEFQKGMVVINLINQTYTNNGVDWYNVDEI